jgi:cephalosporin hydroxylase
MADKTDRRPLSPEELAFSPEEALASLPQPWSRLETLFATNRGRYFSKWPHYLRFYEQAFEKHVGLPVRMLEIGVQYGGSLDLWRKYFGGDAVLFGIDIDPKCLKRVDAPNQVRIGSQDDPEFLRRVVDEMGGLDIVLDDGSHVASHQRTSFRALWPLLATGGVYVIEDIHSSYWQTWEGGYRRPGTAVELVKELIDDLHGWFHAEGEAHVPREELGQIVIGDSIVAIHKVNRGRPGYIGVGLPPEL